MGGCMNRWRGLALSVLVCGLAACGGSGSSTPPPASPPSSGPPAATNAAPIATADNYQGLRDDSLAVAAPGVLANDSDANSDALTVRLAASATHGTLTLQPNGSFSYTPAAGFTGTDQFTYAASDGTRESAVVTVTIA